MTAPSTAILWAVLFLSGVSYAELCRWWVRHPPLTRRDRRAMRRYLEATCRGGKGGAQC